MKSTLALDLGMDTGYAVKNGRYGDSGSVSFTEKPVNEGVSYQLYLTWLRNMLSKYEVQHVVIEDVGGRWINLYAQRYYFGFRAVTVMTCEYYGCQFFGYHQGTIKKNIIGSGKADKIDIVTHYRQTIGVEIENDDHADALMLLDNHELHLAGLAPKPVKKTKKKKS